ncbi:MAG: tetratricopeptide repeat protein [Acidobacteriota bacterium]|nr:tetratricopeptide repeat protein [Acidobacteriota bacterium]
MPGPAGRRPPAAATAVLLLALAAAAPARAAAAPVRGLTDAAALSHIYDRILDADFSGAAAALASACPPAPAPACETLGVVNRWWRMALDPENRSEDAAFSHAADAAIHADEAWTEQEPERAEAWLYLGGALAARVQWKVLRGQRLSAARDGVRIKDALERALALDPSMQDAWFGIGLYHYYAAIAPLGAKILRWLLLLPGGSRTGGLQEMLRTHSQGELLKGEADYQLHLIYLWYEHDTGEALRLLDSLRTRYPGNPLFPLQVAAVQDAYLHDHAASLATAEQILRDAGAGHLHQPQLAEAAARLQMATELSALGRVDDAIAALRAVVAADPSEPYSAVARAHLGLGTLYDRTGRHDLAAAEYRAAIDSAPADDPYHVRDRAREALAHEPPPRAH